MTVPDKSLEKGTNILPATKFREKKRVDDLCRPRSTNEHVRQVVIAQVETVGQQGRGWGENHCHQKTKSRRKGKVYSTSTAGWAQESVGLSNDAVFLDDGGSMEKRQDATSNPVWHARARCGRWTRKLELAPRAVLHDQPSGGKLVGGQRPCREEGAR
ncbi:hypothetical protein BDZ85DRAFT_84246 [Elsinoe ampelina]|uniref:Uncharacterized protein n=1 Tax=Elsinoe ampelina TaxID=302913 RepID=A0A6A6GH06_9PEZI|nr:hypothetical protein BDZ85DRAFT_84246 [Elsinoe ampelina]